MPEITEEQRRAWEEKIKNMSPEELKEFQKQQCVFCQIIAGKVPSKKVYEDGDCLAVMDINPAAPGHVLLFPKEHYAIMPQIPDEIIGKLFAVAKHLSHAMLRRLRAEGTSVFVANGMVAGQKAQHFMIHIVPRKDGDGLFEIPGRLLNESVKKELALAVGNRVNELLGIKKEKVSLEEKEGEDTREENGEEKEGKEADDRNGGVNASNGKEKVVKAEFRESKKEDKEPAKKDEKSPKKPSQKKPAKKEEKNKEKELEEETGNKEEAKEKSGEDQEEREDKEETAEEKGGVSLDDIARLFK